MTVLVVGAGLAGATAARVLSDKGHQVIVKEARDHIAGNCFDSKAVGTMIHKYGPHIFHTNSDLVWNFLSQFTEWHQYYHRVTAQIHGQFVPIPFNFTAIDMLFPKREAEELKSTLIAEVGFGNATNIHDLMASKNSELKELGEFVYETVFKGYTIKQWGPYASDLTKSVLARVPINCSYDDRYFKDKYQGIPLNGYTKMVENMLSHSSISVTTEEKVSASDIFDNTYDHVVYTGAIDELFEYCDGKLPYRSLQFKLIEYNKQQYPTAQTNFPNDYGFTRCTDMALFPSTCNNSKSTLYFEYPHEWEEQKNERYYPVPAPSAKALYNKYKAKLKHFPKLILCGRLAEYQYFNMDQAVANAIKKLETVEPV